MEDRLLFVNVPAVLWEVSPRLAFTRDVTRCEAKVGHFHFPVEGRARRFPPSASHVRKRSLELLTSFFSQQAPISKKAADSGRNNPNSSCRRHSSKVADDTTGAHARLLRADDRSAPGNRCVQTTLFRAPKTPPGPRTFAHTVWIDRKFNTRAQVMQWHAPARLRTHRASAFAVCATTLTTRPAECVG